MKQQFVKNLKLVLGTDNVLWYGMARSGFLPAISVETRQVLECFHQNEVDIHVAGASSSLAHSSSIHHYLDCVFKDIHFKRAICADRRSTKLNQLLDLGCQHGNFMYVDSDLTHVNTVQTLYPSANCIYIKSPLTWEDAKNIFLGNK
jgi:hypothetical protein